VLTDSMKKAISETDRRRLIQSDYNEVNGITPQSIIKPIDMSLIRIAESDYVTIPLEPESPESELDPKLKHELIANLEARMREAAKLFEFEKAAQLRDRIKALKSPTP